MRSIEIGRIQKSKSTSIVVEIMEIEGQFFVNIREYVKGKKFTGFTKKGLVFRIEYLNNVISLLQDVTNFISSNDWKENFDEMYNVQTKKSKEEREIIDKVYEYLNNKENKSCSKDEIKDWIKYCYESKQYKLAIRLFDSVDKEGLSDGSYKDLMKIVEICRIKSE